MTKESPDFNISELLAKKLESSDLEIIDNSIKYIKSDMKDYLMVINNWRNTAVYNTLIYKVLDDKCDVYNSYSLSEFGDNINTNTRYLHEDDKRLVHRKKLKGFLVMFPTNHLLNTGLKSAFIPPTLVT